MSHAIELELELVSYSSSTSVVQVRVCIVGLCNVLTKLLLLIDTIVLLFQNFIHLKILV